MNESNDEELLEIFPEREFGGVVMTPMIMSGEPCIKGRRIGTHILAGRYTAGESAGEIADDFEITVDSVEDAIRFELRRRASRVWWKWFGYTYDPQKALIKHCKSKLMQEKGSTK